MKIISKYKDYYDWAATIYGVDTQIVLDRRGGFGLKDFDKRNGQIFKIAFCELVYTGVWWEDKIIWGDKIKSLPGWNSKLGKITFPRNYKIGRYYEKVITESCLTPQKTPINKKRGCPILLSHGGRDGHWEEFPKLMDYNFGEYVPPQQAATQLYNWLAKQKDDTYVDNRSDTEKLESAGFHKKTSFRNIN